MTLGDRQRVFTRLIAELIVYAYDMGYELTFGDAFRDNRVPYGHPNSLHKKRLAVDFNLFKNGEFLQKTEDHKKLGEYWESLDPGCSWGGRFSDGNHYSYKFGDMR